jgi:hypothetical protein
LTFNDLVCYMKIVNGVKGLFADADSLKFTGISFHAVFVEPVNEDT